jgi:hypothetical protein
MRLATRSGNCSNRRSKSGSSSRFLGVSWLRQNGKWRAQIGKNGHSRHLGLFDDEVEAAKAYDAAARETHREFASLNFGSNDARQREDQRHDAQHASDHICCLRTDLGHEAEGEHDEQD